MATKAPKVIRRQFDTDSLARFMELVAIAESSNLELSLDRYAVGRKSAWVFHIFSAATEKCVAKGRGETAGAAVVAAYGNYFKKTQPAKGGS